ncbi:TPA: sialate O-acetylesterase [Photobacterium damselae]
MGNNNIFQMSQELRQQLDWLNQILKGGDRDTVTINGVVKPTISKDIADKWAEIKIMVSGRQAYSTKSAMDADLGHAENTLAEVWNDPNNLNNGLYGKTGEIGEGGWVKSSDDLAGLAYHLAMTKQSAKSEFQSESLVMIPDTGLTGGGGLADAVGYETSEPIFVTAHPAVVRISLGMSYSFAHRLVSYDRAGKATSILGQNNGNLTDYEVTLPPDSVEFRVCNDTKRGIVAAVSSSYEIIKNIEQRLDKLEIPDVILTGSFEDGIYINRNGGFSTDSRMEVARFDCLGGEELLVSSRIPPGAYAMLAFYDIDQQFMSLISYDYGMTYINEPVTVPLGATSVAISNFKPDGYSIAVRRISQSYEAAAAAQVQRFHGQPDYSDYYLKALSRPSYQIDTKPIGLIVLGQSNTDGRAENANFPLEWTEDSHVHQYSKNLSNVRICKNDRSGAFQAMNVVGQWAYDAIVQNKISRLLNGENFYTVKRSHGGTPLAFRDSISNFNPDIAKFNCVSGITPYLYELELAIRNAMEVNPDLEFKAILFHQGESDGDIGNRNYFRDLARLVYYIRGVVGNVELPFIFGSIPSNSRSYREHINADFVKLVDKVPHVYMIDMEGQPLKADQLHFDHVAQEYLGDQMYQILRDNHFLVRS